MEQSFLTLSDFSLNDKSSELFITFGFSEKTYALPAEKIIEIVQLPALTLLEKTPDYIIGLLNLRGTIISVVDLSMILGFERKFYSSDCQVLILNANDKKIGVIVDSVKDVIQFEKKHLEPLPYFSKDHAVSGIFKDDNGLVAFLDFDKIAKHIEAINIDEVEIHTSPEKAANLFPVDQASIDKFAKRALKLQKELRIETDSLNYQEDYYISFALNEEIYCINLKYVREITKLKNVSLTKVPCVPEFITGIINLRGDFITIIDIKKFLNVPKTNITEKTKIIVIKTESIQIGLLVDDVFGIKNIRHEKLNHNAQSKYEKNKYTSAEIMVNNKVMCVFDLEKFLEDERLYIEDAV
jgi:purine-binding chemotaxis protein CheW